MAIVVNHPPGVCRGERVLSDARMRKAVFAPMTVGSCMTSNGRVGGAVLPQGKRRDDRLVTDSRVDRVAPES